MDKIYHVRWGGFPEKPIAAPDPETAKEMYAMSYEIPKELLCEIVVKFKTKTERKFKNTSTPSTKIPVEVSLPELPFGEGEINQRNLPVYPNDHQRFKEIAVSKKMSMKDLFHQLVEDYPTWPVVVKAE